MPLEPLAVGKSSIRRARRFLDLADETLNVPKVKNDLRRMAVVMSVAAVDSYLHRLVLYRASVVRRSGDLPKRLAGLDISFDELAVLADASVEARKLGKLARPWVHAKNALRERLLQMTFQSADQVATALSMAGIDKSWSKISGEMNQPVADVQQRLNRIVHRRNQIVHESDVPRKARPRRLEFNSIKQSDVSADVDWIESLINAVDVVALI